MFKTLKCFFKCNDSTIFRLLGNFFSKFVSVADCILERSIHGHYNL